MPKITPRLNDRSTLYRVDIRVRARYSNSPPQTFELEHQQMQYEKLTTRYMRMGNVEFLTLTHVKVRER